MKDFLTDEEMNQLQAPPDFISDEDMNKIDATSQGGGIGQQLKDEFYIDTTGIANVMPYPKATQHALIDPIVGLGEGAAGVVKNRYDVLKDYLTGKKGGENKSMGQAWDESVMSPDDVQNRRDQYEDYLRQRYPGKLEGANAGGTLAGATYKAAMYPWALATEGLVDQSMTRPESLGANLETGLNVLPVGLQSIAEGPRKLARGIARLKMKPEERSSLDMYEKNPKSYDDFEKVYGDNTLTGGPKESLIREVKGNLETHRDVAKDNIKTIQNAIDDTKANSRLTAQKIALGKQEKAFEEANYKADMRDKNAITPEDAELAKDVIKKTKDNYMASSNVRREILKDSGATVNPESYVAALVEHADNTANPALAASLERAAKRIKKLSGSYYEYDAEGNVIPGSERLHDISAEKANDIRKYLQDQVVNWGEKHQNKAERGFTSVARSINNDLDNQIPVNNEMRSLLRQQTKDFDDATEMFGGDFNLSGLKNALKDPQKMGVIDRIQSRAEINPDNIRGLLDSEVNTQRTGINTLDVAIKKARDLQEFEDLIKRKYPIPTEASRAIESMIAEKSGYDANTPLLNKSMEAAKAIKTPMSPDQAESTLQASFLSNKNRPRINQTDAISEYSNKFHPHGPEDFQNKWEKNKVLRDLYTADVTNGSKMVNAGNYVGRAVGALAGGVTGGVTGGSTEAAVLGAGGAMLGGYLDNNASGFIRGGIRASQSPTMNAIRSVNQRYVAPTVGAMSQTYREKVQGTKYANMFIGDPQKDAIAHKLTFARDPEYARLVSGDQQ